MKKLLIIGAGGHERCCLDIARDMDIFDKISFFDDNHIDETINDYKVIFIAVGNNKFRKELSDRAKKVGFNEIPLISPRSIVSKYALIKRGGTVVFPNAVINANAGIGSGCIISTGAVIDHDAIARNYCYINDLAVVSSMAQIPGYTIVDYGQVYRNKDIDETWEEEYVKQFGEEPNCFCIV